MYFGETSNARAYFETIGYPAATKEVGTAEHVIDCISTVVGGASDPEAERQSVDRLNDIAAKAKSAAGKISVATSSSNTTTSPHTIHNRIQKAKRGADRPAANILQQFRLLMTRSLREVFRGKGAMAIKIVQQVTLGLVYGGIYHLGMDQSSIMDRFGLLSLIAIGGANMAVAGTIRSFPKEKAIVGSEMASNMYGVVPYFVAKAVSELPLLGVFSAIFGCIIYPLSGLQRGRFRTFIGLTSLSTVTAEAVGLLIGSVSATSDVALALLPPTLVLSIIFDGKNISTENIPRPLRWIQNVGLVRWCFESLCINEFEGLEFDASGPRRGPVVKTGTDALARFGLLDPDLSVAVMAQLKIVGACWFLSMLGLSLTKQKFEVMHEPTL